MIDFLKITGNSICVGAMYSKQEYEEAQHALDVADALQAKDSTTMDVCILSGYIAQVKLITKLHPTRLVEFFMFDRSRVETKFVASSGSSETRYAKSFKWLHVEEFAREKAERRAGL